jgi:glycerophosphoryl diester phosphodiesterase
LKRKSRAPAWLTARPVAHRGLHDITRGIVENMPAAAQAAIAGQFAIECDIQLTADGEAMVYHDDDLDRLTEGSGALLGKTAAELKAVKFKDTSERMMTLSEFCALIAGRVPLIIEVKSHFDGDRKLVARMAEVLASYSGPVAGMSFDPDQVMAIRERMPKLARGITAEREYTEADWPEASPTQRRGMLHLRHAFRTRPHFIAYSVNDLPALAPGIARDFGCPLLTWTVRTPEQRERAARYADQIIFEGFRPEA